METNIGAHILCFVIGNELTFVQVQANPESLQRNGGHCSELLTPPPPGQQYLSAIQKCSPELL